MSWFAFYAGVIIGAILAGGVLLANFLQDRKRWEARMSRLNRKYQKALHERDKARMYKGALK